MSRWWEKSVRLSSNMVSELGDVETRSLAERRMEKGVGCPEGTPLSPGVPGPWERGHPVGEDCTASRVLGGTWVLSELRGKGTILRGLWTFADHG